MSSLDVLRKDLVIANRVLAREEVVDAYGHVSVRHPDNPERFLIARSLAPELVGSDDIVELDLDGQPVGGDGRSLYLERFIHAAIFAARPDVMAVVHAHAEDTLPFGIAQATKLRPVIHAGSFIGSEVPVWDIADNFGDTNLLVTNMAQGRDLASCLGGNNVALMRRHGFASAARSLIEVARMSVYLARNARTLLRALQLGGEIKYLSPGEIAARNRGYSPYSVETCDKASYYRETNERMLVCALLEDAAVLNNLDTILSVPGIDLFSIGPNDFAQSLGYPGQPDHPEVIKTMQEITRRIRQAGRTMQLDVMQGAWVSDMLLDAGGRILSS